MKKHLISILASVLALSHTTSALAATPTEQVASLAQGCYAIKSPASNKYVKQYHSGGTINGGESFGFRTSDINQADQFFFKPTRMNHFMLTSQNGRFLASILPAEPTAGTSPGKFAEWYVQGIPWGSGFRYRLKNIGLNRTLRHNYSSNNFYYFDLLNPNNNTSEHEFWLVPRTNCTPFTEMQVNVSGDRDALKGYADQPVRGMVDAHTHIFANEFMGGKFLHGDPFNRFGVTEALNNSDGIHGPYGALDLIGNIFAADDINNRFDTRGWPEFPYWPSTESLSHTGYYWKWIERAYLGGTRMMVSHMVENKVLCKLQSTINPASWINPNSCEAKDSVRLQVQRHYEMQDYIDAQYGGTGKGWFRIVKSPEEARQVIADGKMAIIMGIEASEIFDCGVQGSCNRHNVEQEMQEMYDLGIRGFFPTHRFDNKISGSELEGGFINAGQWLSAGYLFDVEECQADTEGVSIQPGFPLVGSVPVIGSIVNGISNAPDYDPHQHSCNQHGLTELGVYVINRMVDMGFLIELDHTSDKTARKILDILEARNYSGVISAHSHLQKGRNDTLHPNMKRLMALGGFTAPYNYETYRAADEIGEYLDEVEKTPFLHAVGMGTDMSGLADQAKPRIDADSVPLEYPFTSEFGLVFDRQISGNRTMDYNVDGMAHYGMLADHLQDIRERAPDRIYESLMNSAEAYLQMWERARNNSSNGYSNPLTQTVKIVNRHSGECVDVPGDDDNVSVGVRVLQSGCTKTSYDQRWIYNANTGNISSDVDRSICLDSRQTRTWGQPLLRNCQSEDWTKWSYRGYNLFNKANAAYDLAAEKGGSRIWLRPANNDWNHMWELRTERDAYNWVTFRTAMGNGCMDVNNADTTNGNHIKMEACHDHPAQLFYYLPKDGTLRTALNTNKCVDLPNGNTANGTTIVVWDCNGGINQKWDLDGGIFRSRINRYKVMDINGSHHGAKISIWDSHGGNNQRWRAVVQ